MSEPPKRRFQFRLRTLMIVVMLLAVPLGYVGWQAKTVRQRQYLLQRLKSKDTAYPTTADADWRFWTSPLFIKAEEPAPSVPLVRKLLGDQAVVAIVYFSQVDDLDFQQVERAFPEAKVKRIRPFGTASDTKGD